MPWRRIKENIINILWMRIPRIGKRRSRERKINRSRWNVYSNWDRNVLSNSHVSRLGKDRNFVIVVAASVRYACLTISLVVEVFEVLVSRMMNELKNTTETLTTHICTRHSVVVCVCVADGSLRRVFWQLYLFSDRIYTLCIVSPNRVAFWNYVIDANILNVYSLRVVSNNI